MSQLLNVVIVMSRCARSREPFGMRFEQLTPDVWAVDWAFRMRENTAQKEGYDQNDIKGRFAFGQEYPGCPYCHNQAAILCPRCGKVTCSDPRSSTAHCGWCGMSGQVGGGAAGSIRVSGDV